MAQEPTRYSELELWSKCPVVTNPNDSGSAGVKTAKRDFKSTMGRVPERDFRFTMKLNRASPKLFLACAESQPIQEVTLFVRRTGGKERDYLVMTLTDVMVSSFQTKVKIVKIGDIL